MRRRSVRSALLPALAILALAAAGCGGGGGGTNTTTSTVAETTSGAPAGADRNPHRESGKKEKKGSSGGHEGSSPSRDGAKTSGEAPLSVSGGGSAQFKVKGGDNSVQEYGAEAGTDELREAASAVHGYLVARFAEEWKRACSYFSAKVAQKVEQLAGQLPSKPEKSCASVLAAMAQALPPSGGVRRAAVDAASLRREGEHAFLIYTGPPGKTVYSMPVRREGGEWKVSGLESNVLPGT